MYLMPNVQWMSTGVLTVAPSGYGPRFSLTALQGSPNTPTPLIFVCLLMTSNVQWTPQLAGPSVGCSVVLLVVGVLLQHELLVATEQGERHHGDAEARERVAETGSTRERFVAPRVSLGPGVRGTHCTGRLTERLFQSVLNMACARIGRTSREALPGGGWERVGTGGRVVIRVMELL